MLPKFRTMWSVAEESIAQYVSIWAQMETYWAIDSTAMWSVTVSYSATEKIAV